MRVLLIGAGHVGLTTGAVLSKHHKVTLVDIDKSRVDAINQGICPIHEEGLEPLLQSSIEKGNLKAEIPSGDISPKDIVLICVGTPSHEDGSVNLDYVDEAAEWVFEKLDVIQNDFLAVGIKSTIPPGTTRKLIGKRLEMKTQNSDDISLFYNPEFLQEGSAIKDAEHPDRVVIGCDDEKAYGIVKEMYQSVLEADNVPFVKMTLESAEMCKYASNSFLATKISFANEMADIAEAIPGADIDEVFKGVGLDKRISPDFFGSGAGYGGSCFPKDISGLIRYAENKLGMTPQILKATHDVNSKRPGKISNMLSSTLGTVDGMKIAILGYAFKPGTDDTRESPTKEISRLLSKDGAEVWIHDPMAHKMDKENLPGQNVWLTDELAECLTDASACVLVTSWSLYQEIGLSEITQRMAGNLFIDGRRVFVNEDIPEDVQYLTIGSSRWFLDNK